MLPLHVLCFVTKKMTRTNIQRGVDGSSVEVGHFFSCVNLTAGDSFAEMTRFWFAGDGQGGTVTVTTKRTGKNCLIDSTGI